MVYRLHDPEFLDIILPGGAILKTRPVTSASNEAARAAAERRQKDMISTPDAARDAGFDPDTEMRDPDIQQGLFLHFYTVELGRRHIVGWEGISDASGEKGAEVTPENIERLLRIPVVGKSFFQQALSALSFMDAIKKDSGGAVNGISSPAVAPAIAEDATT